MINDLNAIYLIGRQELIIKELLELLKSALPFVQEYSNPKYSLANNIKDVIQYTKPKTLTELMEDSDRAKMILGAIKHHDFHCRENSPNIFQTHNANC